MRPVNFDHAKWDDTEDGMLTYMWIELGQSMGQIGRVIKRSRNAVAGRIKRLNISRKSLAKKKSRA